jgi:hypothetical protein
MALFDTGQRARAGDAQAWLDYRQQLSDLHERGVLSDEEFAAEKAKSSTRADRRLNADPVARG